MTRTPPLGTSKDPHTGSWVVVVIGTGKTLRPLQDDESLDYIRWNHWTAVQKMRELSGAS